MLKFRRQALRAMPLVALSAILTSCASLSSPTQTTATTANSACLVWKTITYSGKNDTDETVRQIIENNAARKSLCGN